MKPILSRLEHAMLYRYISSEFAQTVRESFYSNVSLSETEASMVFFAAQQILLHVLHQRLGNSSTNVNCSELAALRQSYDFKGSRAYFFHSLLNTCRCLQNASTVQLCNLFSSLVHESAVNVIFWTAGIAKTQMLIRPYRLTEHFCFFKPLLSNNGTLDFTFSQKKTGVLMQKVRVVFLSYLQSVAIVYDVEPGIIDRFVNRVSL